MLIPIMAEVNPSVSIREKDDPELQYLPSGLEDFFILDFA